MDMTKKELITELEAHVKHMRIATLKTANGSGTNAHLGGILSILEALAVLYGAVMNDKELPYEARDKFILSKGHAALSLYAALAEFGVMDEALLGTFMQDGSDLVGRGAGAGGEEKGIYVPDLCAVRQRRSQ